MPVKDGSCDFCSGYGQVCDVCGDHEDACSCNPEDYLDAERSFSACEHCDGTGHHKEPK